MVRPLVIAVIAAIAVVGLGCAKWQGNPAANYVTIQADSEHDTDLARKDYKAARNYLNKRFRGEACDLVRVEKKLQRALAADVRFGPAHHTLGVLYFWQKKLYLAAWEFEYANRLMPDRFEPLNNLGLVYESVGKFEPAKSFYCLAREKAANQPDVIAHFARASDRSGTQVDQMRPLLEDVLATNPRPEWRRWAADLLGVNPPQFSANSLETVTPQALPQAPGNASDSSTEELPLIAPPQPTAEPAPLPLDDSEPLPPLDDLFRDIDLGKSL
jgi:tetratricopeptide (TPR) repeat protein